MLRRVRCSRHRTAAASCNAAAAKAQRIGANSERERDYLTVLRVFQKDWDSIDHRTRVVAFEKAMEER